MPSAARDTCPHRTEAGYRHHRYSSAGNRLKATSRSPKTDVAAATGGELLATHQHCIRRHPYRSVWISLQSSEKRATVSFSRTQLSELGLWNGSSGAYFDNLALDYGTWNSTMIYQKLKISALKYWFVETASKSPTNCRWRRCRRIDATKSRRRWRGVTGAGLYFIQSKLFLAIMPHRITSSEESSILHFVNISWSIQSASNLFTGRAYYAPLNFAAYS